MDATTSFRVRPIDAHAFGSRAFALTVGALFRLTGLAAARTDFRANEPDETGARIKFLAAGMGRNRSRQVWVENGR